jgi:hypothetical protein
MKSKILLWLRCPIAMTMLWCICRYLGEPMPEDIVIASNEG